MPRRRRRPTALPTDRCRPRSCDRSGANRPSLHLCPAFDPSLKLLLGVVAPGVGAAPMEAIVPMVDIAHIHTIGAPGLPMALYENVDEAPRPAAVRCRPM